MLEELILENFKCYKNEKIEFDDVNIITGTNSSGKSTILQALKLHSITEGQEVNLRCKDDWDFIGFKELLTNDASSEYFSICLNGEKYKYEEYFYNKEPRNNIASVTCESGNDSQPNNIIFINADRYVSRNQMEGNPMSSYIPSLNNAFLADFLYFNSDSLKGQGMISRLSKVMKEIGIVKSKIDIVKEVDSYKILIDNIDIAHVGTGVRYVLPIILTILSNSGSTICIENPEIHLHPRAQIKLMEIIILISNQNDNQIIVETHSDHIINACRVMVKERSIKSEEILINFVTEKGIESIRISGNGRFNHLLPGFFDEYEKQLVKLL